MELECAKYKEKMKAEDAVCKHPGDYCKYRTSCIIHFMSSENKNNSAEKNTKGTDKPEASNDIS